jgi:hypothetical protein
MIFCGMFLRLLAYFPEKRTLRSSVSICPYRQILWMPFLAAPVTLRGEKRAPVFARKRFGNNPDCFFHAVRRRALILSPGGCRAQQANGFSPVPMFLFRQSDRKNFRCGLAFEPPHKGFS